MDLLVVVYSHTKTGYQVRVGLLIQIHLKTLGENENTPKQYFVKILKTFGTFLLAITRGI